MKKLLSLLLISGIALGAQAQDKKFQIGLVLGTTINSAKIQTSEIEKQGVGGGFTIGIGGNYMFSENVGLASGVQFDLESFKINYGSNAPSSSGRVFYGYNDSDILKYDKDTDAIEDLDTMKVMELTTRKFKGKYVTVPLFLKFQTNLIGKFKYYGKFGLRTSFLVGSRFDDTGYNAMYSPTSNTFIRLPESVNTNELRVEMKPVTLLKGLTPIRTAIGIYGGAEWNFTGSTFLYLEAGFNYGITPSMQIESGHLVNQIDDAHAGGGVYGEGALSRMALDIKNNPQHLFEIKLGLLF
ncbi:MAG: hypothetical protein ACI857_001164 [Arenicella sp.]|jgi:hypothetical protein